MKFNLPLPPTTNHAYGISYGRIYKTYDCRTWEKLAFYEMQKEVLAATELPFTGNIRVKINLYLTRNRDIDGSLKLLLDLLQLRRVINNDNQITVLEVTKEKTKKNAYVIMEVNQINYEK
ncbi:MAG: hypothetical protein A2Y53_03845 [Chloroflexi bacterium RBG_16_47_49]|nr:MAG: hypothetical protein A2Y53_03845 [Chloroflexi bacterium RBG_16_47_49]